MSVYINLQEEIVRQERKVEQVESELSALERCVKNEHKELCDLQYKRKELLQHMVYMHQVKFLTELATCAKIVETKIDKNTTCVVIENSGGELIINVSFEYGWKTTVMGDFPTKLLDRVHQVLRDFSKQYLETEVESASN